MALGKADFEIVAQYVPEDQRAKVFAMFVEAAKGMLLSYEEKADRMYRRVKPSRN